MYLTVCPLRGPGSIPCHSGRFIPGLIMLKIGSLKRPHRTCLMLMWLTKRVAVKFQSD